MRSISSPNESLIVVFVYRWRPLWLVLSANFTRLSPTLCIWSNLYRLVSWRSLRAFLAQTVLNLAYHVFDVKMVHLYVKVKSAHEPIVVHQAGAYPGSYSMGATRSIFTPPWMGPSQGGEGHFESKEHNTMSNPDRSLRRLAHLHRASHTCGIWLKIHKQSDEPWAQVLAMPCRRGLKRPSHGELKLANPSWCEWTAQKQAANTFANCWRQIETCLPTVFMPFTHTNLSLPTRVCQL